MLTLRRGVVPSITDFMARRRRRRFHQEFHGGELELSDLLLEESGTR
jgi:hypothetical protein